MKISYNWLKDFIKTDLSPEEIGKLLTSSGLEVEAIEPFETVKGGLKGVVIAKVLTCEQHPNADKLRVTTVDNGTGNPVPVVCGAPNVAAGQTVIMATVGSVLYPVGSEEPLKIAKAKIRGEVSEGMLCAEDELGLGVSHAGILVLDTDLPVGTPASEYFKIENDYVFEIGLTPNRADAASHLGVARDLKALISKEVNLPVVKNLTSNSSASVVIDIKDTKACPRYTGVVIKGLKVEKSPEWLQNRLKAIGVNPINNVVDATNYVLHDLGQPLHAFDLSKITSGKVAIQTLAEGTPFVTLDGTERKLKASDLVICNDNEPMCLAGVFGGKESGVSEATVDIFLESAYFNPDVVRKTSQVHALKTDSSFRFERGTDPNMPLFALKRAAELIIDVAGGAVASEFYDVYPEKIQNFEVTVDYQRIRDLIGVEVSDSEITQILTNLEIQISFENGTQKVLSVPPYRVDVTREADIAEDILRIVGFDKISLSPYLGTEFLADHDENSRDHVYEQIGDLLSANGFYEVVTNSLTKPEYWAKLNEINSEENVEILNKLSEELGVMRQTLLFSGLEVISHNINRRQKDVKIFDLGKIYKKLSANEKDINGTGYSEKYSLGIFLTGNKYAESWMAKSETVSFYDALAPVQAVFERFNVKNLKLTPISNGIYAQGVEIFANGKVLAKVGAVQANILKKMDIKQAVWFADIDIDTLLKIYRKEYKFAEVPKFPEVRRDLSLVLDKKVSFAEVKEVALKTDKELIKNVNIFDVYEGDKIEDGKKSYSVSFAMQHADRTLTDEEINKVFNNLITNFESKLGAVIRK
ncbi:MAG: phenylalanine--tRNA ligase subunit beta [Cytophagales bacterium]